VFSEYNLETVCGEDEPADKRNIMDRSVILAPFNSFFNLNDTVEP